MKNVSVKFYLLLLVANVFLTYGPLKTECLKLCWRIKGVRFWPSCTAPWEGHCGNSLIWLSFVWCLCSFVQWKGEGSVRGGAMALNVSYAGLEEPQTSYLSWSWIPDVWISRMCKFYMAMCSDHHLKLDFASLITFLCCILYTRWRLEKIAMYVNMSIQRMVLFVTGTPVACLPPEVSP